MTQPEKLSSILLNGDHQRMFDLWEITQPADEQGPLPGGEYIAGILNGELAAAKTGTPGFKLTFQILEGEFKARRFWHDLWLTPAALPITKRDIAKLGITALHQLEQPLPRGIRCRVRLALRKDDDGNESNRVRHFAVLGIDPPEQDAFAPKGPASNGGPANPVAVLLSKLAQSCKHEEPENS